MVSETSKVDCPNVKAATPPVLRTMWVLVALVEARSFLNRHRRTLKAANLFLWMAVFLTLPAPKAQPSDLTLWSVLIFTPMSFEEISVAS